MTELSPGIEELIAALEPAIRSKLYGGSETDCYQLEQAVFVPDFQKIAILPGNVVWQNKTQFKLSLENFARRKSYFLGLAASGQARADFNRDSSVKKAVNLRPFFAINASIYELEFMVPAHNGYAGQGE